MEKMNQLEYVESTHETRIPAEAFGGKIPDHDILRFYRLIEERIPATVPGWQHLDLACGHVVSAPADAKQEYAFCDICKRKWDEAEGRKS